MHMENIQRMTICDNTNNKEANKLILFIEGRHDKEVQYSHQFAGKESPLSKIKPHYNRKED